MKEKINEPIALATDVGKPIPVLTGKDAEKFLQHMVESEKEAEERAKRPKTKDELEKRLSYLKFVYEFEKSQLLDMEKEIKNLEKKIAEY